MPRLLALAGFLLLQGLLVALSVPLLRGRIGRNASYGLRTRETLASDDVWYRANRASARISITIGVVLAAVAVALLFVRAIPDWAYFWTLFGLFMGGVVVDGIAGVAIARRLARESPLR
jgi:formate hydrogenlyase subunit 3/multisubunit Na+/H+ antiporter MnhD subunit